MVGLQSVPIQVQTLIPLHWILCQAVEDAADCEKQFILGIKTHGSESRGQEEAGLRDEPVSYLQVAPLWNLLML